MSNCKNYVVLNIDDFSDIFVMKRILTAHNCRIHCADNIGAAKEILKKNRQYYAVKRTYSHNIRFKKRKCFVRGKMKVFFPPTFSASNEDEFLFFTFRNPLKVNAVPRSGNE